MNWLMDLLLLRALLCIVLGLGFTVWFVFMTFFSSRHASVTESENSFWTRTGLFSAAAAAKFARIEKSAGFKALYGVMALVFLFFGWRYLLIYRHHHQMNATGTTRLTGSSPAEAVVQAQVDAYNARNLDAFLDTYADDAQLFEWPSKRIAAGKSQMSQRYSARFAEPELHAEISQRIVLGDMVIDHEKVRRMFPEGPGTLAAIAIYEVSNGKIQKAWLRMGERKLDKTDH